MGEGHRDHLSKILMKTFAEAEIFFIFFFNFHCLPLFPPPYLPPPPSTPVPCHQLSAVSCEVGDVLLPCPTHQLISRFPAVSFLAEAGCRAQRSPFMLCSHGSSFQACLSFPSSLGCSQGCC